MLRSRAQLLEGYTLQSLSLPDYTTDQLSGSLSTDFELQLRI